MADDLQGGICSGNWWNSSPRNPLPCSTTIDDSGIFGGGWSSEMVDMKTRSCEDQSVSVSDSSMVFQQKPQGSDSVSGGGAGSNVLMDSTLQMMDFGISTPTMDWSQELLNRNSGRADNNFHSVLQDELSLRSNFPQESMMESSQVPKSWSPRNFSRDSSMAVFKQINQVLPLDQNRLSSENSSDACTITCQGLPTSFSMESVPYGYQASFLQGLYDPELQSQPSHYENRPISYPFQPNYGLPSAQVSPSWQKFPQYQKSLSPPKPLTSTNQLHFSNKAPFWNPSATSMTSTAATRPSFFSPVQNQFSTQIFEEKPNCSNNYPIKTKPNEAVKKASSEPALKRPRLETPSPLPTFKVRKEKLGDRVTALQQLVSPFGKTDTASVLFEAIEYIKFLHEQVTVLSAPYMKNGASTQQQHQQHQQSTTDKSRDGEGPQKDLRSRGLCLVPMTSIFPVTNESTADFWTPTFGGTYR